MKNKGNILFIMLVIGIATVIFIANKDKKEIKKTAVGMEAPQFEMKDTDGKIWRLSDLRGKVVLLNFWATWCDTCKEEKPYVQGIIDELNVDDKLVYLSVLFKDEPSKAIKYMQENKYTFPVLIDDANIAAQYGLGGVPETFMINKQGVLAKKVIGGIHWNLLDSREQIAKLINE